ncbi:MAG: heparinase II/III family protein [Opitutaceae bacterium]|nr:heparinase II/III family protein [Opitutaceae bacterium]
MRILIVPFGLLTLFVSFVSALGVEEELLFSKPDIDRMREKTELPVFQAYWEELLGQDLEDDQNCMREAFLYLLTGDSERGQRAKESVLALAAEERWARFAEAGDLPLGFLTTGKKATYAALCYDWLYDLFTEEERVFVREAIAEKGCLPIYRALYGMRHPDKVKGWSFFPGDPYNERPAIDMSRWPTILGNNNFRAVINGGFALGIYALEGHDDRVEAWEETLLDSIVTFNKLLKPDGSYDEAVAYANYAMTHQVMAMEVVKRKRGIDFFDSANFQGLMDYVLSLYLPNSLDKYGSVSFGDANRTMASSTAFWVAANARDGRSQFIGLNYSPHDLFSFLHYDDSVKPIVPDAATHFVKLDLDWIVLRDGYEMDDLVLAMRSGLPANHEHADRNSIQFKALGEILLADHTKLNYSADSAEWKLRGSIGHNTVLIDGLEQHYHKGEEGTNESKSSARIIRSGERPGFAWWVSDATAAYHWYNPELSSVTRTVIGFPQASCFVVLDKVEKPKGMTELSALWHVENKDGQGDAKVSGRRFEISRPRARFYGYLGGSAPVNNVRTVYKVPKDLADYEYRYIESSLDGSVENPLLMMAGFALRPEERHPVVTMNQTGDTWTILIDKAGSQIFLEVTDRGVVPEFEVLRNDFH